MRTASSSGRWGRWGVALACAIGAMVLASACADEEIVLATLPPSFDGGQPSDAKRCVDDSECAAKDFCARAACGDVAGSCAMRPVICEDEAHAVCGCDGITYWNDCLRRTVGITAMTPGECASTARVCAPRRGGPGFPGTTTECPASTFCARLLPPTPDVPSLPDVCGPDVPGTCWALPAVCPERAGPDRWIQCLPTNGVCVTTCDAIRSGESYKRAKACP